jgi:hypothetical protein
LKPTQILACLIGKAFGSRLSARTVARLEGWGKIEDKKIMKTLALAVVLVALSVASARDASLESLPKPGEIFVIASTPYHDYPPYFTPESLSKALPEFRRSETEIGRIVHATRYWQSGVIVLTNKSVLFWTTCSTNFINIVQATGSVSFVRGDGKANY